MKIYITLLVMKKCKSNPQRDNTAYLLGWLKLEGLTAPKVEKGAQELELLSIAGGVQNGATTLENNMKAFYRVKNIPTL